MKATASSLVALAGLAFQANAASVDILTCSDWELAVEETLNEDTLATIITSAAFFGDDCGDGSFKTLEVKNNHLTVVAPTLSDNDGPQFFSIRFAVTSGGELTIEPNVEFNFSSDESLEVNGGFLYVGEDSKARFKGDLDVNNFAVRSVPEESSDFSDDAWDGGCVANDGYFRVDGLASFQSCDNIGGGESSPGRGGAIFNGETGSILFEGGVEIKDTSISDDEGNDGAGIYNLGKVNIKGDSLFQELRTDTSENSGGAIYNGAGAKFTFRNKATATFVENGAARGGAIYNAGDFKFSGPALFTLCFDSAIYNVSPGTMKLSDGSVFWKNSAFESQRGGAVTNLVGATLDIGDDITFSANSFEYEPGCENIYLQEQARVRNSDFTGYDPEEEFTCYP